MQNSFTCIKFINLAKRCRTVLNIEAVGGGGPRSKNIGGGGAGAKGGGNLFAGCKVIGDSIMKNRI